MEPAFEKVAVNNLDLVADLAVLGPVDVPIEPATMIDGEDIPIGSRVYLIGYPGEYELFPQPTITGGVLSRLRQWSQAASPLCRPILQSPVDRVAVRLSPIPAL